MIRIIPASAYRTMAWKNGGGSTTEIAVAPGGAGLDTFDWRVSMAEIRSDGPFSQFPGIDRTLAILGGDGIRLTIDDGGPVDLTQASVPISFPGDLPAAAMLVAGPVTDLNVMSRRGRVSHRLTRFETAAGITITADAPTMLIFCRRGSLSIETAAGRFELKEKDTLLAEHEPAAGWHINTHEPVVFFTVAFR